MSRPFPARFSGSCHVCLGDIDPGQLVHYDDDGLVVHADAADCDLDESTPPREQAVCPSCWLAHAGECA